MVEWKFVSLLMSYCCNILGGENMSAVRHDVSVKQPFARCTVTWKDNMSCQEASEISLKDILVRLRFMADSNKTTFKFRSANKRVKKDKLDSDWGLLKTYSLLPWSCFLEEITYSPRLNGVSIYSLFTLSRLITCISAY